LSITYTQHTWTVVAVLVLGTAVLYLVRSRKVAPALRATKGEPHLTRSGAKHLSFLVPFRASLQLVTIACILAVDFQVFPRRFAKTETFGTSLMDLGVGAFIFSGGVVAGPRLLADTDDFMPRLSKSFRTASPVLLLGIVRMILTKGVNYQEHVTEYGVHWNFFITLGLVPIFVALFRALNSNVDLGRLGLRVALVYMACLRIGNLEDYILNAPRDNIINMNREGICSFFGYLAIFLFAAEIGIRLQKVFDASADEHKELLHLLGMLVVAFFMSVYTFDIRVSRRMANISYIVWVSAASLIHIIGCAYIDKFLHARDAPKVPLLFESINQNQLAVFLVANLLTGAVNLTINTLAVPDIAAFAILAGYLFSVSAVATVAHALNWRLKL
ncbi:GWT1-domain-containing protein, partial [Blyttiomyces helicus]